MLQVPDATDAARAKQRNNNCDLEQLQTGHRLYIKSCGGCHTLYLQSYYKSENWAPVLDEMAEKAKLSGKEKEIVLNYLVVMSEKPKEEKK